MQDFQKRVVEERTDLEGKIMRLDAFIHGAIFKSLPVSDQSLMHQQVYHMRTYSEILRRRIEAFDGA